MAKLYIYDVLVGEILTNRSMTIDEALKLLDFNEEKFLEENGFEGIDYNDFVLIY